ncbi:MAG: glycosyltransferase family 4 protein [Pseudomonadota bacterium]
MNILFIIPGDINLPTGGYRYDRAIIEEWRRMNLSVELLSLEGNFPGISEHEKQDTLQQIRDIPNYDIAVVDGLAGGAHPEMLRLLSKKIPAVALIHHPLCMENGLDQDTISALHSSEAEGLQHVSGIITTSPETSKTVISLFGISESSVHHVLPGVNRSVTSTPSDAGPANLLCVGSVIERKGHLVLIEALASLAHLDWHLHCIGKTDFQPDLFAKITNLIEEEKLDDRITFYGAVDEEELEKAYSTAHVFVLPSLFEGYGMAYAEAIVRGLPVIGTRAGAIPDTVPERCGILVEPGDVGKLAEALQTMISEPGKRRSVRSACLSEAGRFPTWRDSASKFASILGEIK